VTAPGLAITGGTIAWGAGIVAFGLLLAGAILVVLRRRRRYQD
jgi:LPXTG-motif cell wall-anchored protein